MPFRLLHNGDRIFLTSAGQGFFFRFQNTQGPCSHMVYLRLEHAREITSICLCGLWLPIHAIHNHDGIIIIIIKWNHCPRYWPFVRGIHRSPVNSPDKGQWRGALMFSLICTRRNGWVNNREAGDLRRHRTHYDVIVMFNSGLTELNRLVICVHCISAG